MRWDDLNMGDKSRMIKLAVDSGITDLRTIRDVYNSYADGGFRRSRNKETQQVVDEDNPSFVGPTLEKLVNGPKFPENLYNGPEVPYGFYDAPIDWERKKALQHYNESSFKANQVSKAGAMGPYQIMPRTWNHYKEKLGLTGSAQDYNNSEAVRDEMMDELLNAGWVNKGFPSDSVRAAKALMGYNWGTGNAIDFLEDMKRQGVDIYHSMDWVDKIPNSETRNYVNYILRERNIPGGKTIEGFEKALPHRFDAFPEAKHANGGNLFWPGGQKKALFDKQKVLNRVYGDGQAFSEGNTGITSSIWEYLFNKDDAVDKRIKDAELGAEKYKEVLKSGNPNLVYNTFKNLSKDEQRLFNLGQMVDVIKQHEDAKRIYLGYEPKYGYMEKSKDRPTIGKSDNPYQVNPLLTDGEFDNLIMPLWSQWKTGEGQNIPIAEGYSRRPVLRPRVEDKGNIALVRNLPFLSDATMSEGFDEKGQYISLYDVWDYNTNVIGTPGDNVGKYIGGKPFEIYQRYYLDDWFDIPENERGYPYIAPAYVTAEKASGGKIHIKPENRGKFTALKKHNRDLLTNIDSFKF